MKNKKNFILTFLAIIIIIIIYMIILNKKNIEMDNIIENNINMNTNYIKVNSDITSKKELE